MQRMFRSGRYANVTATLALIVALGGTSYAAVSLPRNSVGSRQIRANAVKNSEIKSKAVGKSELKTNAVSSSRVANDSLTGSDIKESTLSHVPNANTSAFNEDSTDIAVLGPAFVTVASTSILTSTTSRVIATGSAGITGAADRGQCQIVLDGVASLSYEGNPQQTVAVTFARVLPAGAHTVLLRCRADVGFPGKDDAAVAAWSVGV